MTLMFIEAKSLTVENDFSGPLLSREWELYPSSRRFEGSRIRFSIMPRPKGSLSSGVVALSSFSGPFRLEIFLRINSKLLVYKYAHFLALL